MTVSPVDTPATIPELVPIVATPGDPDDHAPPDTESARVIPEPAHNAEGPAIADGNAFTVTIAEVTQPEPIE